jgi:hypothetical protein
LRRDGGEGTPGWNSVLGLEGLGPLRRVGGYTGVDYLVIAPSLSA